MAGALALLLTAPTGAGSLVVHAHGTAELHAHLFLGPGTDSAAVHASRHRHGCHDTHETHDGSDGHHHRHQDEHCRQSNDRHAPEGGTPHRHDGDQVGVAPACGAMGDRPRICDGDTPHDGDADCVLVSVGLPGAEAVPLTTAATPGARDSGGVFGFAAGLPVDESAGEPGRFAASKRPDGDAAHISSIRLRI